MTSSIASKTAQSVNELMKFDSEEDREELLNVISDYFCPREQKSDSDSSDSENETGMDKKQ